MRKLGSDDQPSVGGALTDGLGDSDMKTQGTEGKRSLFPAGITLLADPEHLDHQEDPLEEHEEGDDQHDPLLGGPWGDADDGEDDRETSGPDSTVVESTNWGQG